MKNSLPVCLSKIFETDTDSSEGMEAELLVTLIEKYEKEHYPASLARSYQGHKINNGQKRCK